MHTSHVHTFRCHSGAAHVKTYASSQSEFQSTFLTWCCHGNHEQLHSQMWKSTSDCPTSEPMLTCLLAPTSDRGPMFTLQKHVHTQTEGNHWSRITRGIMVPGWIRRGEAPGEERHYDTSLDQGRRGTRPDQNWSQKRTIKSRCWTGVHVLPFICIANPCCTSGPFSNLRPDWSWMLKHIENATHTSVLLVSKVRLWSINSGTKVLAAT